MLELRYADADDIAFIIQTQSLDDVKEFICAASKDEILASIEDPEHGYLLAINAAKKPVGFAFLRQLNSPQRSIEIHRLAIAERNKGYGSRFLKLITAEAFDTLNANRLWLDVFPENARARKVYQNCGFVEEGLLRDNYFLNGAFQSTIVMSILAREYAEFRR